MEWSKYARSSAGDNLFGEVASDTGTVTDPGPDGQIGTNDDTTRSVSNSITSNIIQGVAGIPVLIRPYLLNFKTGN